MALEDPFELKLVLHLSQFKAPRDGIDIVVIPGVWALHSPEKATKKCSWLKPLSAATPDHDTRIFVFKYEIKSDANGAVWHHLLNLAPRLLDALRQVRQPEFERRPLFFICHGLGSVILKRTLYLATSGPQATYRALAGIIFLGAPHLTSVEDQRWDNWRLILQLYRRGLSKTALRRTDIEELVRVCERFGSLTLRIPIFSVFETVETKIRQDSRFETRRSTEVTLVDKSHATTGFSGEELFGIPASHSELQYVNPDSDLFRRLVKFFRDASEHGVETVAAAYERLHFNLDFSDTHSATTDPQWPTHAFGDSFSDEGKLVQAIDDLDFSVPSKRLLLPCYSLGKNRNPLFHGREDILNEIHENLKLPDDLESLEENNEDRQTPLKSFIICGLGGMGKTEIAREYTHRFKLAFEAIFWINSASEDKLNAGFIDIAIKLGLQTDQESAYVDPSATRDIVHNWLASPTRTTISEPVDQRPEVKWLIVFDNVDDPDTLVNFWPRNGVGSVLVTSRNPLVKEDTDYFTLLPNIDLDPMSTEEASKMLQKLSSREKEEGSFDSCAIISNRMGGLPLAIVQMASIIRRRHYSLKNFIAYYDQDAKSLQNMRVPGLTEHQTIASIWNIESLTPSALALIQVLSVLDPDAIPENVLTTGASKVKFTDYPKTIVSYCDSREELINSSLVSRNSTSETLTIHRLVQDVVRQKMSIEKLREVYNAAITLIAAIWPFLDDSNLNKVDRLRQVQKYFPQVSALKTVLEDKKASVLQPDINICALFNEASWYYILQPSGYGLSTGERFAVLSQEVLEGNKDDNDQNLFTKLLADSYRYQGITGTYINNPTAVANCRKWIDVLVQRIEKYNDTEDIKTMPIAYNEIGMALMRVPEKEEAEKSWIISCNTLERVTKPGDLVFPFPWVHRGLVSAYYSREPEKAEAIVAPILKAREDKLGKDDTGTIETGLILVFMGNFRLLQGKPDEAYEFHSRAAPVLKTTCGEHSVQASLGNYRLAVDQFNRKMYKEAEPLLRTCIAFYGTIPWYKPQSARCRWKLGHTLQGSGEESKKAEAKELLEEAMRLRSEMVPDDKRPESELKDDDWDKLVYYFFR